MEACVMTHFSPPPVLALNNVPTYVMFAEDRKMTNGYTHPTILIVDSYQEFNDRYSSKSFVVAIENISGPGPSMVFFTAKRKFVTDPRKIQYFTLRDAMKFARKLNARKGANYCKVFLEYQVGYGANAHLGYEPVIYHIAQKGK